MVQQQLQGVSKVRSDWKLHFVWNILCFLGKIQLGQLIYLINWWKHFHSKIWINDTGFFFKVFAPNLPGTSFFPAHFAAFLFSQWPDLNLRVLYQSGSRERSDTVSLKAAGYRGPTERKLLSSNKAMTFEQDGAPAHTSKVAQRGVTRICQTLYPRMSGRQTHLILTL